MAKASAANFMIKVVAAIFIIKAVTANFIIKAAAANYIIKALFQSWQAWRPQSPLPKPELFVTQSYRAWKIYVVANGFLLHNLTGRERYM